MVPKSFTHDNGKLTGMTFEKVRAEYDAKGRRNLVPTGEPDQFVECDDVLIAVGQENAFPWIERDIGLEFDKWDMPKVDERPSSRPSRTCSSAATPHSAPRTSSGPSPTVTTPRCRSTSSCHGEDVAESPAAGMVAVMSQKMGIHEWSYDNDVSNDHALQGAAGGYSS
jgi:formate dehydrogenase beta subunit